MWEILLSTPRRMYCTNQEGLAKQGLHFENWMPRTTLHTCYCLWSAQVYLWSTGWGIFNAIGDLIEVILERKIGEWQYFITMRHKSFNTVANWILLNIRKLPLNVSGQKPDWGQCGKNGHLSAVCPQNGKNVESTQNQRLIPSKETNENKDQENGVILPDAALKRTEKSEDDWRSRKTTKIHQLSFKSQD